MIKISKGQYEVEEEVVLINENDEELYKFTMQITADEMQKIKDILFSDDVIKTQKQIELLKLEKKYSEIEKLEEEIGDKTLKKDDELYKIWFKEHLKPFKEAAGQYKFEEMTYNILSFFINAFVKQKMAPLNTTITDLQKIIQK